MGLLDIFGVGSTPAKQPHPLELMMKDREKKDRIDKALFELIEQTKYLTKQDIGKWRQAWQRAISVEWPSRIELHAIYRDIEIDGHITAVVGQIKNEVLQKEIHVVDRNTGDRLPVCEKQLEDARWFLDFSGHGIDSRFWGHSLPQFGDVIIVDGVPKFSEIELLDRDHVIPEHNRFVKFSADNWQNGFDYTQPPYSNWVIPIGSRKDLGLYNRVAPHALAKKNILAFWDKFAEIFGMPIRIGKTSSTNPKDRNDISEMLKKMGSAAWGMFPDGTEIDIKETTRGDAWEVYDKRIERANSEISKAIVHQTMTTDNGSSKSQSETHLTIQEKVIEFFAKNLRIDWNDKLIPFMRLHGFPGWENARIKFDDTVEYTVDEQVKIEENVLNHFDVDANYFIDKYGIPIIGKKENHDPFKQLQNRFDFFG